MAEVYPFMIRFIHRGRGGHTGSRHDDILKIFPLAGGKFETSFREPAEGILYKKEHTKEECLNHVETILDMLRYDVDPYMSMQIMCPGSPSILIRMKEYQEGAAGLSVERGAVRLLRDCLNGWFGAREVPRGDTGNATGGNEAESEGGEGDESDEETESEGSEEHDDGDGGSDVDEDGFQRLPRPADEEPSHVTAGEGEGGEVEGESSDTPGEPIATAAAAAAPTTAENVGQPPLQQIPVFYTVFYPMYFPMNPNTTWNPP